MLNNIGLVGLLLLVMIAGYFYAAFKSSWKGKLSFKNPQNGNLREAPIGFSWTTFFFGFFPALLRGHWKGFFAMLLIAVISFGLALYVFPFLYNKYYVKHLIKEGYLVVIKDVNTSEIEKHLGFKVPMLNTDQASIFA